MHRHNLDEIAEYAQGTLADETMARELIQTCEVCAAEYETQTSMISMLASTPPVAMTEHEKTALHRDLWTELRSPARSATRQRPGWRSWAFGAAATVLVVVGAVGVFSNMSGSDSAEEAFNEIGSSLDSATAQTSLAPSRADEAEGADSGLSEDLTPTDGGALKYSATAFAEIAASVRAATPEFHDASSDAGKCIFAAGLTSHKALLGFEEATDLVLAIPDQAVLETAEVSFVDPEACSVVHVED